MSNVRESMLSQMEITRTPHAFAKGELVWVSKAAAPDSFPRGKWFKLFEGPYNVQKQVGENAYNETAVARKRRLSRRRVGKVPEAVRRPNPAGYTKRRLLTPRPQVPR